MAFAIRPAVALVSALISVFASAPAAFAAAPFAFTLPGTGGALGLQLGRGLAVDCPVTQLICHPRESFSPLHGNSLFLVGRAQVFPSFGVYGKLGTAQTRPDTTVMGHSGLLSTEPGTGVSYGGGVSWDFSPRVSATFEWGSYDLRLSTGPVRSTSLGLQIRY